MSDARRPKFTLHVQNLRALASVEWSPSGVSCLVGRNGSGKTTLLQALRFLRAMLTAEKTQALMEFGTTSDLRRLGADDQLVVVGIEVGSLKWSVALPVDGPGVHPFHGEVIEVDGKVVFDVRPYDQNWEGRPRGRDGRSILRVARDGGENPELQPLFDFVEGIQVFGGYRLHHVRSGRPARGVERILDVHGGNIGHVLAAWRGAPRKFADRFEWVRENIRCAFPDLISDIELDLVGDLVVPYFVPPGSPIARLPFTLAADGMLTGLLHLTAVAAAEPGTLLAIDEVETHLHPHAIRSIVDSTRARADALGLTVLMTTHSTVLLDEFDACPDQLYVAEANQNGHVPARVSELVDPSWLANFSLGSLYGREDVGAPRGAS